jgi:hypothetical protein
MLVVYPQRAPKQDAPEKKPHIVGGFLKQEQACDHADGYFQIIHDCENALIDPAGASIPEKKADA